MKTKEQKIVNRLQLALDYSGMSPAGFERLRPIDALQQAGIKRKHVTPERMRQAEALDRRVTDALQQRVWRLGGSWNGIYQNKPAPPAPPASKKKKPDVILTLLREWGALSLFAISEELEIPKIEVMRRLDALEDAGKIVENDEGEFEIS